MVVLYSIKPKGFYKSDLFPRNQKKVSEDINLSTLAKQNAANDGCGVDMYECPETGEYMYFEDLSESVVNDLID